MYNNNNSVLLWNGLAYSVISRKKGLKFFGQVVTEVHMLWNGLAYSVLFMPAHKRSAPIFLLNSPKSQPFYLLTAYIYIFYLEPHCPIDEISQL